jgi:hypothetical protein
MLSLITARILVITRTDVESENIQDFMRRMPFDLDKCKFLVGRLTPTDEFDFAVFNAMSLPRVNEKTELAPEDGAYLKLFRDYLAKPIKYIVYYGEFLHDLDKERCPSANSKFTLFARIRELIDFINHYRPV